MNVVQFIKSTIQDGGASYNINTGESNPKEGYMVSCRSEQAPYKEFNEAAVKNFFSGNIGLLTKETVFLGSWFSDGFYYLDCSEKVLDLESAIQLGMKRNQIAIWDVANSCDVELPSRQKAGTEFQQKEYIRVTAKNLAKSHKEKLALKEN